MPIETLTKFKTSDGKEFDDIEEAKAWEKISSKNIIWREFHYGPDLTEGRHGPNKKGIIGLNARSYSPMFFEYAMDKVFGSRVCFVMGVFGSNAITSSWTLGSKVSIEEAMGFKGKKIIIEERFVNSITGHGPGIHIYSDNIYEKTIK